MHTETPHLSYTLNHTTGLEVSVTLDDIKNDEQLMGYRLLVSVTDGSVTATPIIAMLPPMPADDVEVLVNNLVVEIINIDVAELMGTQSDVDGMGDVEGP